MLCRVTHSADRAFEFAMPRRQERAFMLAISRLDWVGCVAQLPDRLLALVIGSLAVAKDVIA